MCLRIKDESTNYEDEDNEEDAVENTNVDYTEDYIGEEHKGESIIAPKATDKLDVNESEVGAKETLEGVNNVQDDVDTVAVKESKKMIGVSRMPCR